MPRLVIAYLGSFFLSMLGNSVAAVALPLVMLQTTGSALDAGIVAAATAVPAVLAGLFMGSLIDRINRRTSSVVTDLISGAAIAALPLVALATDLSLFWFVLFGVIGSLGDVPGLTAREALLPAIARHGGMDAERLIGLREGIAAICIVIGPAAAGAAFVVFEPMTVLWLVAGLALAAALTTLLIPHHLTVVEETTTAGSGLAGLKAGWKVLFGEPFLVVTTGLTFASGLVLAALQGLVLPVHFLSLGEEGRLGLVLTSLALGLLVGSGVYAVGARARSRRFWLVGGLSITVIGMSVIATLSSVAVVLAGAVAVGFGSGLFSSLAGVMSLERIPDDVRGRVMGTQNALMTLAPGLGILGAAVLTEKQSVGTAAAALAVVWAVAAVGTVLAPATRYLEAGADETNTPEPDPVRNP
ncbi:MFS transporter [Kineosporia babensis]|uniref:Multidrug efflux pump Tap n=1 Tax=Kineosporia babensis TaxID=499548 RepID=A0A9X1NKL7_9ACTN|nr:MFS transporter [Kineosporia babensis]MCD5314901.1 MFS transporter [Kineosporia babensis]